MTFLEPIIQSFSPISLEEMDRVKLLNRTDTKFVMHIDQLPGLLRRANQFYKSIDIEHNRIFTYRSLYYDTDDLSMYHDHHRGKLNRFKIRYREYVETNKSFLEIKFKSNKSRTIKSRIERDEIPDNFSTKALDFLNKNTPYQAEELKPIIWNNFKRLTLVHKTAQERLTIDFNLRFSNDKNCAELPQLAIIELKQDKFSVSSDFYKLLREEGIQPSGMSKYCTGMILLTPDLKHNRFKSNMLNLERISNDSKHAHVFNRN